MSQMSNDEYQEGRLWNGYDYTNQAWVLEGRYVRCGHPEEMNCGCYGKEHKNDTTRVIINVAELITIGATEYHNRRRRVNHENQIQNNQHQNN